MRAATSAYGGMTATEYAARLDAWGQDMLAAFARQTAHEREMKRAAWRAFWDDAVLEANRRIATRQQARTTRTTRTTTRKRAKATQKKAS